MWEGDTEYNDQKEKKMQKDGESGRKYLNGKSERELERTWGS